ncbi:MAG: hypothetical protein JKY56_16795 [Kofleriaceae bacterium]|nr:hypothetical protein [Kofleriaceae bacterium]
MRRRFQQMTLRLSLLVVLVSSGQARADEGTTLRVDSCPEPLAGLRDEEATNSARDNYDRGLVLYEEGDFQGAVDAFVTSYCARAHHASFYNIGQSYERLLDFERSIQYFQRYVDEAGADDPDAKKASLRAEVLRNLPAQVRIATVPAGAKITIQNAAGIRARGVANSGEEIEIRQGNYTMRIELLGYEPIVRDLIAKPGVPYAYYYSLEPKRGRVQITATPANARIFLDDRLVGVGQYSDVLSLGSYKVTVEAPGRLSRSEDLQVSYKDLTEIGIELAPPPVSGRRTLLIAAPIAVGLLGGAAMTELFGQNSSLAVAGSLGITGLAFGGSYYGIPDTVSRGDAWFMLESAVIGATEGALLASTLVCSGNADSCGDRVVTGAALAGGIAATGLAVLTYKRLAFSTGDAALLGSGAVWGIGTGALFHAIFDADSRTQGPLLLIGMNIGALTAAGFVAHSEVSLRRVAIIDLAGVGGLLGGVSFAEATARDGESVQNFAMLGLIAGLTAGTFLTRYLDEEVASDTKKISADSTGRSWVPMLGAAEDASGGQVLSYGFGTRF